MKKAELLYSEKQFFRQWWIWLILIPLNLFLIFGLVKQLILGEPFGSNPTSDNFLIMMVIFMLVFTAIFFFLRLETEIRTNGIYIRFFPFHLNFRFYPWDYIDDAYIRVYNPLAEYGGWGLRIGLFGRGRAYNVSGNIGLQIEFKDQSRLLIGTQRPDEINHVINKLFPAV